MGGEPRSRAARRGALLREGRTGCQGRQPRGNERSDNLMAGRPQQPSTDSDKRSTVSCGTSFATPCGRPLRGRAPSLLLRCHESRTGCQGGQPRGNYEARRTWQDAPDRVASVSSEPKRSFAGREALLHGAHPALHPTGARHARVHLRSCFGVASPERAAKEGSPGGTTKQAHHGRTPVTTVLQQRTRSTARPRTNSPLDSLTNPNFNRQVAFRRRD